jgi:hypothetical protein
MFVLKPGYGAIVFPFLSDFIGIIFYDIISAVNFMIKTDQAQNFSIRNQRTHLQQVKGCVYNLQIKRYNGLK